MIVFLDTKKYQLKMYKENGCKTFSIFDLDGIKLYLGNEELLYVTNAVKTDFAQLSNLLRQLTKDAPKSAAESAVKPVMVVKSNSKGRIHIPDLDMVFETYGSFYPLDKIYQKYGNDILEKHAALRNFLKTKKLEISLLDEAVAQSAEFSKKKREKEDKALDTILVRGDVSKYLEKVEGGSGVAEDAIEIDLDKTFGGSDNNEGTLVTEE